MSAKVQENITIFQNNYIILKYEKKNHLKQKRSLSQKVIMSEFILT